MTRNPRINKGKRNAKNPQNSMNYDNLNIEIEEGTTTASIGYDVRTVAKFKYPEVNKLKVRVAPNTKLRENEFIAFSSHAEWKNI